MIEVEKYSGPAIVLHWLIAVLIMINIMLGLAAGEVPETWERTIVDLHKSIGISVLALALIRIFWRFSHQPPAFTRLMHAWEKRLAHTVHYSLYVLIFALPLSGWIHDSAWSGAATHPIKLFWFVPWFRIGFINDMDPGIRDYIHTQFGTIHVYLGYALYIILGLHILGALKHQFIDKQAELQRMWK